MLIFINIFVLSNLISKKTTAPARLVDATLNNLMENAGRLLEDEELKEKTLEINKNGEIRKWKGKLKYDVTGNKFVFPKSEKNSITAKDVADMMSGKETRDSEPSLPKFSSA